MAARIASVAAGEGWCPAFTRAVFRANFAEDREIGEAGTLREILESLGRDASEVLERAESPENKLTLRRSTEEATALGIFGAPSFTVGGELFWGNDRLEQALAWCRSGGKTGNLR